AVVRGQRHDQRRHRLGQVMVVARRVGDQHLGPARDLRRGLGGGGNAIANHQAVHLAQLGSSGDGGTGRLLDAMGVEIENNKSRHGQITFASLRSFSIRVATSGTLIPALRTGGSETLTVVRRGVTSTPRSPGLTTSMAFLRAFMMFGSEA